MRSLLGSRVRRVLGALLLVVAAFVVLVSVVEYGEADNGPEPIFFALVASLLGVLLSRGGRVERSSRAVSADTRRFTLRGRLVIVGLLGVVLPLMLLVVILLASSSEDSIIVDDGLGETVEETSGPPIEVLVVIVVLAGGAISVWFWSARAVEPLSVITDVANQIQRGSLDQRIGLDGAPTEVQALADSFDQMLDRLSVSSESEQRLIEDTSHELRTPLAALAINNEVILANPDPTIDDYRESAERSRAIIDRLQTTVDDLLLGARSRSERTRQIDNDLVAIVGRAVGQHRVLHPTVPVVVNGPSQLLLGIDGPSVERALVNLLDNAARYSPPGVPIEIAVVEGPPASVEVTDHGPGIAAERADSVFDRYERGDDDEEHGSAGIGLNLVRQVAEAHGGIEVISPLPGDTSGTRFTLTFATP